MKRNLLFSFFLLISVASLAQPPAGFVPYTSKISHKGVAVDSLFYISVRDTNYTPNRLGAMTMRPADSAIYVGVRTTAGTKRWERLGKYSEISAATNVWSQVGNAGTTPGTNFLGPTDSVDFVFKVSNVQHGLFDIDKKNLGFGYSTLQSVTSLGIGNTGFGSYSLKAVTSGDYNVGVGYNALAGITTGNRNVAIGPFALDSSSTNFDLVAIGYQALQKGGTSGTIAIGTGALKNNAGGNTAVAIGYETLNTATQVGYSIAIGHQALYSDTSKLSNIAIGYRALYTNREYGNNIAIGVNSQNLSNASKNTSVGFQSMLVNTTGEQCTAFGYNALYSNTSGIKNNAQGTGAMENNTTGSFCSGMGHDVLLQNTTGSYNVGMGWNGWSQNRTGNYNVGIGASTGRSIYHGNGNTFIGYQAGYGAGQEDTVNNCIALGYDALTTGSNQFVISDSIRSYKLPNIPYSSSSGDSMMVYNPTTDMVGMRAIPSGGGSSGLTVGTTTITGGTNTRILYNNSGALGEYSVTGSGTTVPLSTSPTFTTSIFTPITYGSTTANGTLTLAGNSASSSNTGTNTNTLFKAGNSGSTLVMATYNAGNVAIGPTPSVNANTALTVQSLTNTQGEGLRLYALNNSVYTEIGWGKLSYSGRFVYNMGSHAFIYSSGSGLYLGADAAATAQLHIAAGSATAGTAPIKLTSGTNNTTAEAGAIEYNGTELFQTNSTAVRGNVIVVRLNSSSAGTLTLATTYTHYVFTGTTTTWTLPAVSGTSGHVFYIKNRGSGAITLNTNASANELYTSSAVNTLTINAGEAVTLLSDGSYWLKY